MKEEKITITNAQELRQEKCNVPTLRFREFTDSWTLIPIKKLLRFQNGINADSTKYGKGIKYISVSDILNNQYITYDCIKGLIDIDEKTLNKFIVEYGDILFQRSSETFEDIGRANVYLDKEHSATFGGFVIRGKKISDYNPLFFRYLLCTHNARKQTVRMGAGAQHYNIGQEGLEKICLYFPGLQEQQKISDLLSAIDNKIAVQNKIISDLKVLKKELCRKMLSSITEYKTLGELCSITTGKLDANANNQNGLYPFFTCGKDTLSINNYAFDGEAILIAGNGDIGHTKYYYGKFNAYQRTYVLMGFKADAQFVKMGIDTYLPQKISEEMQGGAMPYIKLSTLTSLKIPFTTEEKQLSIRNHYDTIAQKVENETKILDLLLQQKSYFLNAMFI